MMLSVKLKNAMKNEYAEAIPVNLKNIIVNGQKRGCSGFFFSPMNGLYVYVNTEQSCYEPMKGKILIRYAKDARDFSGRGGFNTYTTEDMCAKDIAKMLREKINTFGGNW